MVKEDKRGDHQSMDNNKTDEMLAKYDPEVRFRKLSGNTAKLVYLMTLILSIFHIYTAGFGVLQEWRHRAFHLAFVLPLVFFLFTVRKGDSRGVKYIIYDLIYAIVGSTLATTIFKEVLSLSAIVTASVALSTFVLLFYFKRREFFSEKIAVFFDFPIFTFMIAALLYGGYLAHQELNIRSWFEDLNLSLVFWGVFLLGTLLSIAALFLIKWAHALTAIIKRRYFQYNHDNIPFFDVFLALFASVISVYLFLEFNNLGERTGMPSKSDLIVGGFAILLVLEGARRSIGVALPIIAILVLINCYLGPYFLDIPGFSLFAHRGYSVSRIIDYMYIGTEGIFGIPLGVVATFVFHFVLFGIFIAKTGLGQLFMDIAMALAGWSSGGPAKVAVVSSGLMGSISGSSIANTVTTGSFTIPLMKKVGYKPNFAGAVEAAASTGGQLMPPIMGAAAFIMAEFLGIPYIKIAACAIIPAFLHFFAVGWMVHLEAKKQGLKGISREHLPNIWAILKERWLLIGPLVIIVYLLISGSSPFLAAFWGIFYSVSTGQIHRKTLSLLITIFLSVPLVLFDINPFANSLHSLIWLCFAIGGFAYLFRISHGLSLLPGLASSAIMSGLLLWGVEPSICAFWGNMIVIFIGVFYLESKMKLPDILSSLEDGTKNAVAIGAACACVGFIVGATTLTGLGLKFATAVIQVASGLAVVFQKIYIVNLLSLNDVTLFLTLIFTAMSCFVLGMGIPTTAQYIIASMIAAPALMYWDIHPLVSHMFVLYYAVLADITPPVALAAYAASGISGGNPFKTGFIAFKLSLAGIFVPFTFVYAPIILFLPNLLNPETAFDYMWFIQVLFTMILGVISLGATVIGYLKEKSSVPERILTAIAAASLIIPGTYTDIAGFVLLLTVYMKQSIRKKKMVELQNSIR